MAFANGGNPMNDHEQKLIWGELEESAIQNLPLAARQMATRERQVDFRYNAVIGYSLSDGRRYMIRMILGMLVNFSNMMAQLVDAFGEAIDLPGTSPAIKFINVGASMQMVTENPHDLVYVLRHLHGDETWMFEMTFSRLLQVVRLAGWFQYTGMTIMKHPIVRDLKTADPWDLASDEICDIHNSLCLLGETDAAANVLGLMRANVDPLPDKQLFMMTHNVVNNILTSPYTVVAKEYNLFQLLVNWANARIVTNPMDTPDSLRMKQRSFLTREIIERINYHGIGRDDFRGNLQAFYEIFDAAEVQKLGQMYDRDEVERGEECTIGQFVFRKIHRPRIQTVYSFPVQFTMMKINEDGSRHSLTCHRFHLLLRVDLAHIAAAKFIRKARALVIQKAPSLDMARGEGFLEGVVKVEVHKGKASRDDEDVIHPTHPSALPWNAGVFGVRSIIRNGNMITSFRLALRDSALRENFIPIGYLMHASRCINAIETTFLINACNQEKLKFTWTKDDDGW